MSKERSPLKFSKRDFLILATIEGALLTCGGITYVGLEIADFFKGEKEPAPEKEDDLLTVFGGEKDMFAKCIVGEIKERRFSEAGSDMKGKYYASGLIPEERNQAMLTWFARVREMARYDPNFNEEDWLIEENPPHYQKIVMLFGSNPKRNDAAIILACLEKAKTSDPKKSAENVVKRQQHYFEAGMLMSTLCCADPEPEKKEEMLDLIIEIEKLARQSPNYSKEKWDKLSSSHENPKREEKLN